MKMFLKKGFKVNGFTTIFLLVVFLLFYGGTQFADSASPEIRETGKIQLVSGKSVIHRSSSSLTRVSIADPKIADFILISPHEIYITGNTAGATNMILWQDKKVAAIYDLEVAYDISQLKQKLHELLPQEKNIRVLATNDSIMLSGRISSSANLSHSMALAEAYAPEGKVRNLLEVGGVHQVMLEVRVAEMARNTAKRLGINLHYSRGGDFAITSLGGLTQVVKPADATLATTPLGLLGSSAVNALFRFNSNSATWTNLIDALKEDGLVKILAEPTLIALSGQSATFLAGGEFPVPVPQGLGTVAIEYRPFGVSLAFTPTVISEDKINIKVEPDVSELDFTSAVQLEGFIVPGVTKRKASTMVELGDGQSFAIAGLLKESIRDAVSKYPVLGDIPILGALFRSRAFQKNETELIIIATPHLVKPFNQAKQPLPTDFYIEPDDKDIYLMGFLEGRKKKADSVIRGEMEGEFGHIIPKTHK